MTTNVKQAVEKLAALAQESRLRIFRLLVEAGEGGMKATAIAEALDLAPATLSFHVVRTVAERLVLRRAAAAQSHAVAYLVFEAIGANQLHSATQPYRPRAAPGRVFDQCNRWLMLRLDRLVGRVVPCHQPPRRAIAGLADKMLACRWVVRFTDKIPYPSMRIAKACKRAQAFDIR